LQFSADAAKNAGAFKPLLMRGKGVSSMTKPSKDICADPSEEITIRIPCALAQRVADHANEKETTVSSVIIEAIDFFLRHSSK
jgi:hypothetical protein